jgi:hypothetical protein
LMVFLVSWSRATVASSMDMKLLGCLWEKWAN